MLLIGRETMNQFYVIYFCVYYGRTQKQTNNHTMLNSKQPIYPIQCKLIYASCSIQAARGAKLDRLGLGQLHLLHPMAWMMCNMAINTMFCRVTQRSQWSQPKCQQRISTRSFRDPKPNLTNTLLFSSRIWFIYKIVCKQECVRWRIQLEISIWM